MAEFWDIVIVGGAVMGSSIAWNLARMSGKKTRILVLEPDPTYQKSASALSAGSIRQQFSQKVNIEISRYGIDFLRNIGDILEVEGQRPSLGLEEGGYLYLVTEQGRKPQQEKNVIQRALGADIALLAPDELKKRFAWMEVEDVALGSLGLSGEGWLDGYSLMMAFRRAAIALGVEYRAQALADVLCEKRQVKEVILQDGTRLTCGVLVNAAGASGARQVAVLCGVNIPVYAKKRSVFSFMAQGDYPLHPLIIDTSGVWWRPEGKGFIAGYSPDDGDETDHAQDFTVDHALFEEVIWPALAARVPRFETLRLGRAWAGHYDMNLFDCNAIVGALADVKQAYLACGFSGHGLQQSPAIGRGMAELILHGTYQTLDLTPLGFERIHAQKSLLECNVI